MKKRILGLLFVLVMLFGMMPAVGALAAVPIFPGIPIIPPIVPDVPEDTDNTVYLFVGESYELELTELDIWEGEPERYDVLVNGEEPKAVADGYFVFVAEETGDYNLEFFGYDSEDNEVGFHTVNIAVREGTVFEINDTSEVWRYTVKTIEMGLPDVKEVIPSEEEGVFATVILNSDTNFPDSAANKVPLRVIVNKPTAGDLEGIDINGEPVDGEMDVYLWTAKYAPEWTDTGEAFLKFDIKTMMQDPCSHTIRLKIDNPDNQAPVLAGDSTGIDTAVQYSGYTVDVANLFYDDDDTLLSYSVSVDGGETYVPCGESYTVTPKTTDDVELMFKAADFLGKESDVYTLTLTVNEYEAEEGSFLINKETESGRLLSLIIKDMDGNVIEGANFKMIQDSIFEDFGDGPVERIVYTIKVGLPATVEADGTVVAHWTLVQNEGGLPFLSTMPWPENDTEDGVFTELSNGAGSSEVYLFDESNVETGQGDSYTVEYYTVRENNQVPVLKEGVNSPATVTKDQYQTYEVDLSTIFEDPEGDELTYTAKVDTADAVATDASYRLELNDDSEHTIVFTATDTMGASCTYTVKLTVNYVPRYAIETGDAGSNFGGTITKILIDGQEAENHNYVKTDDTHRVITVQLADSVADNAVVTINLEENDSKAKFDPANSIQLVDGKATVNIETSGNQFYKTHHYYTIYISNKANSLPVLAENVPAEVAEERLVGIAYELDLSDIFADADGFDDLNYTVSVDEQEAVAADASYSFAANKTGSYKLVFHAKDAWGTSEASYTVNLAVKNSDTAIDVTVKVPDAITPIFSITGGFDENGQDILGGTLTAVKGTSADGWTSYVVAVPDNISRISFRGTDGTNEWGGMSFAVSADMEPVVLRQVNAIINTKIDVESNTAPTAEQAVFKVKYGEDQYAVNGGSFNDQYGNLGYRFLLIAADNNLVYTYYAVPTGDLSGSYGTTVGNTKTVTTEASAPATAVLGLSLQHTFSVVVPSEATVVMYSQLGYFNYSEISAVESVPNGDGTKTVTFNNVTANSIYRVSLPGEITKAGYVPHGVSEAVINWDNDDRGPKYRADYDTSTLLGARGDDSMYVNVNYRNNLQLDVDETFRLRAYRIWEIINTDTDNIMIEPDFHYNIISGSDVIDIAPTDDIGGIAGQSWLDITAKKAGTAILEVTYDAIHIVSDNGDYNDFIVNTNNFTFNASDPARTALIVVQVGAAENDINFNFKINRTNGWDVEFDTVYFVGDKGQIQLKPAVIIGGEIAKVEVSGDKGAAYTELTAGEDGYYTADILSGNNIIRVTKTDGSEHYQLVRGDKIEYVITEVAGSSDQDGIIEAGETIKVKFYGVHNATGKMSGIYNPNQYTTRFTVNGEEVRGDGGQYTYPSGACVEFRVPGNAADGAIYTLTNGRTLHGGWGSARGAHRDVSGEVAPNLNASGASSLGLNLFPDITITVGSEVSAKVPVESVTLNTDTASVEVGKSVALTATVAPANASDKTVTWTSSDITVATVSTSGKVTGVKEGTATITATVGEFSDTCTVTVTEAAGGNTPGGNPELEFGLSNDEILGYVTVSFVDKGVRKSEELSGLDAEFRNPLGTIISSTQVPFKAYDTIASVTLHLLEEKGFTANYQGDEYSNFYLAAIGDFTHRSTYYASFGEFDAGQGSGWMITWDDWFINKGASEFMVEDGDVVRWQYTCQLGTDLGRDAAEVVGGGGGGSVADSYTAGYVESLIDKIGTVTKNSKAAITEAREAYDSLTAAQKKQVENYDELVAAEKAYAELTGEDIALVENNFADTEGHWADKAINFVYDKGLMTGTTETSFAPNLATSRAMIATILYRLAGSPDVEGEASFADVADGAWYADAVRWAEVNKVVSGYADGTFGPNDNITREQLASILHRYAAANGENMNATADLSSFADANTISEWSRTALAWANVKGLITGKTGNIIDAKGNATRAEIATILMRYIENIAE